MEKLRPPDLSCTMSNKGANLFTHQKELKTNDFLYNQQHHAVFRIGAACAHVGQIVPPFPTTAPRKIPHCPGEVQWYELNLCRPKTAKGLQS
jgi:hypothetical protein